MEMIECPRCEGIGYLDIYFGEFDIRGEECELCEGTGKVEEAEYD